MGHWGYGPFENDHAGDWVAQIRAQIMKPLWAAKKSVRADTSYDMARASAAIIAHDTAIGFSAVNIEEAIEALEHILGNKEDVEAWSKPGEFRASVRKQISALKKALKREVALERRRDAKHAKLMARHGKK